MQADSVGGIAPAVLVTLRPGEKVLASHGLMLYKEHQVQVHRRTMKSLGVSRGHLMGMHALGDNDESYFFAEFEGPGHVSFSRDKGGEVRVLQLAPGQTLRLRDGHLICFDETVRYYPMVLAQYPAPYPDANGQRPVTYLFADELTGPGTIVYQSVREHPVVRPQTGRGDAHERRRVARLGEYCPAPDRLAREPGDGLDRRGSPPGP